VLARSCFFDKDFLNNLNRQVRLIITLQSNQSRLRKNQMNKTQIVATALALSLSLFSSNAQAAEAAVDLAPHIKQVIAEIHVGTTDWKKMIGRIDRLVAHIDEQVLDGTGDVEQLNTSRERLLRAKNNIQEQHLTSQQGGELVIHPIASAPCEICGQFHGAPEGGPAPLGVGGNASAGGFSGGGGGGGGIGGFGGIGMLGGIGAAIAIAASDGNNSTLVIASPSN
jgi:hypothetical protein